MLLAVLGVIVVWLILHVAFFDFFIYHDSWKYGFPILFGITKQATCGGMPSWLGMIDNGSPLIIYLISVSLTQALLQPFLLLMGCLKPDVFAAMYAYKAQIYLTYAGFAGGMYFMGLALFRHRSSAVYLFAATLFAGMCLDNAHSSQIAAIVFWVPWVVIAAVFAIRSEAVVDRALWVNFVVLLLCAQLLDQYPHFVVVSVLTSVLIFFVPRLESCKSLVRVPPARLWPAALVVILTVLQLGVIRAAVDDYQPALRSDILVTPEQFGETGFLQPTAFVASFFPLAFVNGFDYFGGAMAPIVRRLGAAAGNRWFIFRLDALLMVVGVIPMLLAAFFLFSKADRKKRLGMAAFVAIMVAISMQQTKIYLLMFHLPFFNLFRSYFLFTPFAVFGLLLMSAYGLDYFQETNAAERRSAAIRACALVLVLAATALALLLVLFKTANMTRGFVTTTGYLLLVDIACFVIAVIVFLKCAEVNDRVSAISRVTIASVLLQSLTLGGLYLLVGDSGATTYAKFGLRPSESVSMQSLHPGRRMQCLRFPECYLAPNPTVSLNTDLDGTFLRNRAEPAFFAKQIGIESTQILSGLSMGPAWIESSAVAIASREGVVEAIKFRQAAGEGYGARPNYVVSTDVGSFAGTYDSEAYVRIADWTGDTIRLTYKSANPAFVFLALNWDGHWIAMRNGSRLPLYPANLGGTAFAVDAGEGEIRLQYSNILANIAWYSRILIVLVSAISAVLMAWQLTGARRVLGNSRL